MAKFVMVINEQVTHQHRLVVECEDKAEADLLADLMDDEGMYHPDDITIAAINNGGKVIRLDRDCLIETDYIEVDEVLEEEEE